MGTKRIGLARVEALLEAQARDLAWGGSTTFKGYKRLVEAVTNASAAARTLTAAESGTLFTVNMATVDNNLTFTLPATSTSAGVFYDFCFLVASDDDADFILQTAEDAADIYGGIITLAANSTVDAFNGVSSITVDGSVAQSAEGLHMHVLCDGVNWHLSGHIATAVGTVHLVGAAGTTADD
tara:strand:- start:177 stop:722 length:546 start_codon:yes stop_codon:yes gene_type:complete